MPRKGVRGRHRSTCKDGKKSIQVILGVPGVLSVILGQTTGRGSVGGDKPTGYVKIQRPERAGFKALLQCSYGAQEIFIQLEKTADPNSIRLAIEALFD